ncbi:MAG: hypothetical protein QOK28_2988 [Actinomycetota bacterium]|jgi:hypothetical protein
MALGTVIVVILIGDAAAYTHAEKHPYPSRWDSRVARLVSFVEDTRHLRFKHPVAVEFLTNAEYAKLNQTDEGELSADEKKDLRTFEGQAHALGLISKETDLLKQLNTIGSDATLAYYDDVDEKMVIKGTQLTVGMQVTVVHELTHALQDQNFDIGRQFDSDGAASFFDALVEGDATRVENAYVDSLSDADQNKYFAEDNASRDNADHALADVPPALLSLFGAPYDLGEPLATLVVDERGTAGLNVLFRTPADSDEGLIDAFAALDKEHAKKVKPPALKAREHKTDSGDFGAVPWYVVLSSFIDPHTALTAVDGWGGDAYIGYRKDNKPCIRIAFEGDTVNDNAEMATALAQWKSAFTENTVQVAATPGRVELDACEPNVVPKPRADSENALELPATRFQLIDLFASNDIPRKLSECLTSHILTTIPLDKLNSDSQAEQAAVFSAVQQIRSGCSSGRLS